MSIALFILLIAFFVGYVSTPVFTASYRSMQMPQEPARANELQLRKQEVLVALSDLEYDYRMQKMGDAEYEQVRETLLKEGTVLIQQLDRLQVSETKTREQ